MYTRTGSNSTSTRGSIHDDQRSLFLSYTLSLSLKIYDRISCVDVERYELIAHPVVPRLPIDRTPISKP